MRTLSTLAAVSSAIFVVVAACQPKQDAQPGYGYPQGGGAPGAYPTGQAPPPQYGYGAPTAAPPATAPGPVPTAAPAGSGAMAVPGPIAFQCKDDVPCGTHHCNLQYGKCAFPCQSAVDCLNPNSCVAGFCVPAPGGAPH
ncbi:MAG TPA: hypothetical protein VGG39_19460 [Polyangiaceae bacterium]|jgi:hypothetical protein